MLVRIAILALAVLFGAAMLYLFLSWLFGKAPQKKQAVSANDQAPQQAGSSSDVAADADDQHRGGIGTPGRLLGLALAVIVGIALLYLSRFWIFDLWPREGLFGIAELRPQGGLLGQWLRGTPLAPFELLLWACGAFLVLSLLQNLVQRLTSDGNH